MRLKVRLVSESSVPKGFQFHIGAIKSLSGYRDNTLLCHFNSTLVRLKVMPCHALAVLQKFQFHICAIKSIFSNIESPSVADFNSTLVRLKEYKPMGMPGVNFNFNSTLVRLKVQAGQYRTPRPLFQFHIGAIKSSAPGKESHICLISIPHWCD